MASSNTSAGALTFTFSTQRLRAVLRDGEPWFVAADVCAVLGVGNTTDALYRLDEDEQALVSIEGRPGHGAQSINLVSESGLYSLILGSRKPEAKAFKRWVTHEVLPAIRKTGRYEVAQQASRADMQAISDVVELCASRTSTKKARVQAIWFALRAATGVPSPAHFRREHLPVVAEELRRAWAVFDRLAKAVEKAERDALRRLVRGREDPEPLLVALEQEVAAHAREDEQAALALLSPWQEQQIASLR